MDANTMGRLVKAATTLLNLLMSTSSKIDFLEKISRTGFTELEKTLSYSFLKVNETAYNILEKEEIPGQEIILFSFMIAAIANKIEIWDGSDNSVFYSYSQFGKQNFDPEQAKKILADQKAINNFSQVFHRSWLEVNENIEKAS